MSKKTDISVRITQPGAIFATKDGERELKVGEVVDIPSEDGKIPDFLTNKAVLVSSAEGKLLNDSLATAQKDLLGAHEENTRVKTELDALQVELQKAIGTIADLNTKLAKKG
jgi:hypothetical protein